jgi:hypothetical protein
MESRCFFANTTDGREVKVRQTAAGTNIFMDESGQTYDIYGLDLTNIRFCSDDTDIQKHLEKMNEESKLHSEQWKDFMTKTIDSFDVTKQDDHRAEIAEREYWRKLRGDIFIAIHGDYPVKSHALEVTKQIFDVLYDQDKAKFPV